MATPLPQGADIPAPTKSPAGPASPATPVYSAVARAYLDAALDWIQQNSIRKNEIDWTAFRNKVWAYPRDAQTTEDTYPAIRYALTLLADGHGHLYTPEEAPPLQPAPAQGIGFTATYPERMVVAVDAVGSAGRAGVRVGDAITAIDGVATAPLTFEQFFAALFAGTTTRLTLQRSGVAQPWTVTIGHDEYHYPAAAPAGRLMAGGIGYLALPGNGSNSMLGQYANYAQQLIRQIDQQGTCGWIVDLRDNGGGRLWPMLAGVGPILGQGLAGFFLRDGQTIPWGYRAGAVWYGDEVDQSVAQPYELRQPDPPVAILTNRYTVSAAEATEIAFGGRPATRHFGQPTAGAPNAPIRTQLSDGAVLQVAHTKEADRTGHVYDGPIAPDQLIAVDQQLVGTDRDPTVLAASAWLRSQPGCAR
ncbi:MAG TPA: S41 family peptidase [Chloroflexia bacterium]|nr:S41 family peptidase [Chloroflexia bacterium]